MRRPALAFALAATTAAGLAAVVPPASAAASATPTIVFSSNRDGDSEIYRRAADGSVVQLTRNRAPDYGAVWSPDGRRIAFVSARDGDDEIFVMNADGTDVRQLTRNTTVAAGVPAQDQAPAWSPDGRRIAFASTRDGGEAEIYVMAADGTGQRRLTRTAAWVVDHTPAWSPNGLFLVFASNRVGYENTEIFRMRADGSGLLRLTRTANGIDENAPDYSPDGKTIVFSSNRRGTHDVWLMHGDGSWVRGLTGSATLDDVFPRFTADGAAVVFATFAGPNNSPTEDVWVVDSDRTDRRRLVATTGADTMPDPQPLVR